MNERPEITEVLETTVPMVFNPITGEFEPVKVEAVTDEGPVAEAGDITIH